MTTSEEKAYYEALFFIIQTSYKMQYFTIFQDKLHSFNIQDHRSTRGLLRNRSKNFQNHLYGQPVLTFDNRQICDEILKELRFNVIKNLLSLFFINGFITMCNLKKRLILNTPASDVYERLKTNGKAMKITLLRLPTINKEI